MDISKQVSVVILGAGPAGISAASQLARRQHFDVTVLEASPRIGGNSGSFALGGLNVDFGSHRLHPACAPHILSEIRSMLGPELIQRPRHGRIRLWNRWVHFPLRTFDLAANAPLSFWLAAGRDALRSRPKQRDRETFASVLEHKFGPRVCQDFYFPYARKIWGLDPSALHAEQARRRVSARSAVEILAQATSLVHRRSRAKTFYYPRNGYGRICEAYGTAAVAAGVKFEFNTKLTSIQAYKGPAVAIGSKNSTQDLLFSAHVVLSTIPITTLLQSIRPTPPAAILEGMAALRFRAMVLIYLVLDTDRFTEFDAHYFPGPEVPITRCSEPKNYGLAGVSGCTVLCLELPCSVKDPVWNATEMEQAAIGMDALTRADLPVKSKVVQVAIRRIQAAYPIYTTEFRECLTNALDWLEQVDRVITLGRQGLFTHTNTHHVLELAHAASESIRDDGTINRALWARSRLNFDEQVVQD
jgi:protoporphyrinogen oxidase